MKWQALLLLLLVVCVACTAEDATTEEPAEDNFEEEMESLGDEDFSFEDFDTLEEELDIEF